MMKKKIFTLMSVMTILAGTLTGCSGNSNEPKEVVYLEESEITDFFNNPNAYKGKHVKLIGQVFSIPQDDEERMSIQIWHDVSNYDQDFIAHTEAGEDIKANDYVIVDGKVDGTLKGENSFGGEVVSPLIVDAKVTKSSYKDIVTPTIAEISPAVSQDQNGIVVTVDKVEYAKDETRLYVTIKNGTDYNFSCGVYSSKLVIDGQQLDQNNQSMTIYNTPELQELSYEVMAGTSSSGTVIFPAIEQNEPFQFVLPDSYSDNYDLMFTNYMIDVPAK